MRTALFFIALAITDLAPEDVRMGIKESYSVLIIFFIAFIVMDIIELFKPK